MPLLDQPKSAANPRAPQPAPPVRQYSFTDFQVNNPTSPPPGDRLDGEYDRTNGVLADTITWVSTSLNSDGSLKPGTVGKSELQSGLFDNIGADAQAQVEPLVSQTQDAARAAWTAAEVADASALAAGGQNALAQDAASRAEIEALGTAEDAASAALSAAQAAASATSASNSANHADLSEAVCTDYGVLTQAWAEHMPDTIPPNILAVMDVTGDHWSSRWWANRAHQIVEEDTADAICDLQHYWMGAYPAPPTVNNCGEPVVAGAMYFNTTQKVSQVYDGLMWHDVTQPVPGQIDEYLYLPLVPTTVFTGVDYRGHTMVLDPVSSEIGVYLNGVKLLQGLDYSMSTSAITMLLGPVTTPNTVEIIALNDLTRRPPAQGVKVNTTPWVFDGVAVTFPLKDSGGADINPPGAVDCLVSLNGVMQEAGSDFTVNPGFITFYSPPEADADRWMVVGLPLGGGTAALPLGVEGDQLVYVGGSWTAQRPKYVVTCFVPGVPAASQLLLLQRLSKAITIPANFGTYLGHTSMARGTVNATASTAIDVGKATSAAPGTWSSVGTITIAAGAMVATFASSGGAAITFAPGDSIRLVAPATPDATFANFAASLVGYET